MLSVLLFAIPQHNPLPQTTEDDWQLVPLVPEELPELVELPPEEVEPSRPISVPSEHAGEFPSEQTGLLPPGHEGGIPGSEPSEHLGFALSLHYGLDPSLHALELPVIPPGVLPVELVVDPLLEVGIEPVGTLQFLGLVEHPWARFGESPGPKHPIIYGWKKVLTYE